MYNLLCTSCGSSKPTLEMKNSIWYVGQCRFGPPSLLLPHHPPWAPKIGEAASSSFFLTPGTLGSVTTGPRPIRRTQATAPDMRARASPHHPDSAAHRRLQAQPWAWLPSFQSWVHVTKGEKKLSKCEKYTQDHPSQPLLGVSSPARPYCQELKV